MIRQFINFCTSALFINHPLTPLKGGTKVWGYLSLLAVLLFSYCTLYNLNSSASNPFLKNRPQANQSSSEGSKESYQAEKAVLIILDASGSMADQSRYNRTKMLEAKEALENVLSEVDPSYLVGLRVYGSSSPSFNKSLDCQDSLLLVTPQPYNRASIVNELREIKPNGETPIGYAMRQAIRDLESVQAEEKKIILISDGQDTCGYDPCSFSRSLRKNGLNFKMDVVGFGGIDLASKLQLKCIAHNLDGEFYSAENPEQLTESLMEEIDYEHKVESSIYEDVR